MGESFLTLDMAMVFCLYHQKNNQCNTKNETDGTTQTKKVSAQQGKQSTEWKTTYRMGKMFANHISCIYQLTIVDSGFLTRPVLCQGFDHVSPIFSKVLWALQNSLFQILRMDSLSTDCCSEQLLHAQLLQA